MWKTFISLWKNIFNYSEKAGRKEFWLGSVANIIAMYVALIPVAIIILLLKPLDLIKDISPIVLSAIHIGVFLVPLISLYVRRANDVGLKKFDILLTGVAVPAVGAMIIGLCPSNSGALYKGLSWCFRLIAIGFAVFFYGSLIELSFSGTIGETIPIPAIGLILMTISMIVGAAIVKVNESRKK